MEEEEVICILTIHQLEIPILTTTLDFLLTPEIQIILHRELIQEIILIVILHLNQVEAILNLLLLVLILLPVVQDLDLHMEAVAMAEVAVEDHLAAAAEEDKS